MENKESLLYKKIRENLRWAIESRGHPPFNLKEVLSEAKQDFPEKIQVMANKPSSHDFYDPLEVDVWRKKWFGSVEEK